MLFLHNTSVLSFYIDVVLTISIHITNSINIQYNRTSQLWPNSPRLWCKTGDMSPTRAYQPKSCLSLIDSIRKYTAFIQRMTRGGHCWDLANLLQLSHHQSHAARKPICGDMAHGDDHDDFRFMLSALSLISTTLPANPVWSGQCGPVFNVVGTHHFPKAFNPFTIGF